MYGLHTTTLPHQCMHTCEIRNSEEVMALLIRGAGRMRQKDPLSASPTANCGTPHPHPHPRPQRPHLRDPRHPLRRHLLLLLRPPRDLRGGRAGRELHVRQLQRRLGWGPLPAGRGVLRPGKERFRLLLQRGLLYRHNGAGGAAMRMPTRLQGECELRSTDSEW